MKHVVRWAKIVAIISLFTLAGCHNLVYEHYATPAPVETNQPDENAELQQLAASKGLEYRSLPNRDEQHIPQRIGRSMTMHKTLSDYADQLAMRLMERAFTLKQSERIAVASFVRFNKTLREPTVLGNRLSEALIAELQQYGMSIVETKLGTAFAITPYGDLSLSRDTKDLSEELQVDYILTGTLIERNSGVEVNARIVAVDTQVVATAASLHIPHFVAANEHFYYSSHITETVE